MDPWIGKELFQAGDAVFGTTSFAGNGFAHYACATEENLVLKPDNLSFEDAAAVPIAAITALQGLRDHGKIQPGCRVLILAVNGHHSIFEYKRALAPGGIYVAIGGMVPVLQALILGRPLSLTRRKTLTYFIAKINHKDLMLLADLLQTGKVVPVIDRRYGLNDAAEALRYLAQGHAQGKIVLTVSP